MSHCLICQKNVETPCLWEVSRRGFLDSTERVVNHFHVELEDLTACPNITEEGLTPETLTLMPGIREQLGDLFARASTIVVGK